MMELFCFYCLAFVLLVHFTEIECLSCGDPGPIYNGTILGKSSFNEGAMLRFKCNKCFEKRGASAIQCSRWGHWSGDVPKCLPNKCPDLVMEEGERLLGKEHGAEYHFKCDLPAVLIGRSVLRCTCYGRWSAKPPVCRIPTTTPAPKTTEGPGKGLCPTPEKLVNGDAFEVKLGNSQFYHPGDRIYFLCNARHRLIGPNHRECGFDLKWDGDHPYCQRKSDDDLEPDNIAPEFRIVQYCDKLFPPINGEVMGSNQIGQFMEFRCDLGYMMVGKAKSMCQRNGMWLERSPKCKPACQIHKCPAGKRCKLHPLFKTPFCECQKKSGCSSKLEPLCANDGKTYENSCMMKLAACEKNKELKKLHDGKCMERPVCHIQRHPKCTKKVGVVYRYNADISKCELSKKGTCHKSGWNGFSMKEDCEKGCLNVCSLNREGGSCLYARKAIRWMYSSKINNCRRFVYSGCQGNGNNFASHKDCRAFCTPNEITRKRRS